MVLALRRPVVGLLTVAVPFAVLVCWLDYSAPISVEQDRRLAWVDRALPRDGKASLVHLGYSRPDQPCGAAADWEQQGFVVWTEFFNTRIDRVFRVGQPSTRDNLESPSLTIGAGGVVLDGGRPFSPKYAVLDSRQPVVGTRLAQLDLASLGTQYQDGASLTLWKVDPPLRFLGARPTAATARGRRRVLTSTSIRQPGSPAACWNHHSARSARTRSVTRPQPCAVEPERSQKTSVASFRRSGAGIARGLPQ